MKWKSLALWFPDGFRRGARAQRDLMEAYRAVFRTEHGQMVLADIANDTGFYRVNGEGVSPDDRAFSDGKRAAFGRIYRFLNLTDEEQQALQVAARAEAMTDATEGQI